MVQQSIIILALLNKFVYEHRGNNTYVSHTAIPYRASTGSEQGFPCVVFPHREKLVFIAGFPVDGNRFFPVGNTTQGKLCFHYRDGFAVQIFFSVFCVCFLSVCFPALNIVLLDLTSLAFK